MTARRVPLYTGSPPDAALDVAVSHALLREAAEQGVEAVRVWTPPPAVSFGRLDLLLPGHERAIAAARRHGLHPVRRLAGGRAAAIGAGTACLGWASPSPELAGMQDRYRTMAELILQALERLGLRGRVGELEGEWCPGAWSVLVGERKVGGLAQRVIKGGAWAEAVIVVDGAAALARGLDRVQQALGVSWDPATLGQLSRPSGPVTAEQTRAALIDAVAARRPIRREPSLPPAILARATELRGHHDLLTSGPSPRRPRPSDR